MTDAELNEIDIAADDVFGELLALRNAAQAKIDELAMREAKALMSVLRRKAISREVRLAVLQRLQMCCEMVNGDESGAEIAMIAAVGERADELWLTMRGAE